VEGDGQNPANDVNTRIAPEMLTLLDSRNGAFLTLSERRIAPVSLFSSRLYFR
jgi:hypothetical protein